MLAPFVRVRKTGLAIGQVKVSTEACIVNNNKIGSPQEPCRTPMANGTYRFRAMLTNFHINQSTVEQTNHDVGKVVGLTEAAEYCEKGLPLHSIKGFHQVNQECPHFKPMFLAFAKSDERSKKAH
jgi:hypothetical protein